jgi:predicted lysophospholipase L1 biosynthesis ABC-type transport system permease subunit
MLTVRMGLTDTRRLQVGTAVSTYPGLDGSGFAVVDLGTWQLVGYGQSGAVPAPTGWWITTADSANLATDEAAVLALQTGAYRLADVRSRAAETRARLADPIAMSILGTLAIVAAAALVFALLGTLAASWAAGRVRRGEVATLMALGLERRGLLILVVLEEAFPVAVGLAGGVALGAALGIAVLPAMIRAPGGAMPIPAPIAAVPWDLVAALAVAGVVLGAATSLARTRSFGRMDLASTIRDEAPGAGR